MEQETDSWLGLAVYDNPFYANLEELWGVWMMGQVNHELWNGY